MQLRYLFVTIFIILYIRNRYIVNFTMAYLIKPHDYISRAASRNSALHTAATLSQDDFNIAKASWRYVPALAAR